MRKNSYWLVALVLTLVAAVVVAGCGQSAETKKTAVKYPEKAITTIAFTGPGGGSDIFNRQSGKALQNVLGKPVVTENRVGGSGAVAMQNAAEAKPDGYTLMGVTNTLLITPIRNNTPKSMNDFVPIARMVLDPMVVYVRVDSKYDTTNFINAIKNGDGSLKVACSQAGSPETISMETLAKKYNGKIHMVPYPDSSKAMPAVLGGDVDAGMGELAELIPQLEAKTIKVVMALTSKRVPSHPDVPTFVENGYADVSVDKFRGWAAPKGTPPEVIKILEDACKKALEDAEYKQTIAKNYQVSAFQGSEEFGKFLKETEDKYRTYFAAQKK